MPSFSKNVKVFALEVSCFLLPPEYNDYFRIMELA